MRVGGDGRREIECINFMWRYGPSVGLESFFRAHWKGPYSIRTERATYRLPAQRFLRLEITRETLPRAHLELEL